MEAINFKHKVGAMVERRRGVEDDFVPKGRFHVEVIDKDGNVKHSFFIPNGITNEGKNGILDTYFNAATQISTWFIGLVDNAGFSAFAAADTMASHTGWSEAVGYSGGVRPTWTVGAASAQSVTNAVVVTFTMTGTATIHGIFITSNSTLGGTSGKLWSTGAFAANISVVSTDTIKVTYTVSC